MIKNIVFDMGGVLIRFDRQYFIDGLGVSETDGRLLMNEVFRSVEWARLDRGSLDEDEAAEKITARLPERLRDFARSLVFSWEEPICPVEGMYELIEELKANGYPIYLLSNASRRQREYWPKIPASRFFDGRLVSADYGIVKPQPEIYRLLCGKFGLKAEECFFIDDSPPNIEAAFYCGMPGAVFNGETDALRRSFISAGVQIKAK